jgi:hypothetical protein
VPVDSNHDGDVQHLAQLDQPPRIVCEEGFFDVGSVFGGHPQRRPRHQVHKGTLLKHLGVLNKLCGRLALDAGEDLLRGLSVDCTDRSLHDLGVKLRQGPALAILQGNVSCCILFSDN